MGAAIGEVLPFAVAIGFFPIPIIAVILMLFSPNARANGVGFVAGWMAGVAAVPAIVALATESAGADTDAGTHAVVSWIKLVLGAGLLVLAYREWRRRPAPGQDAAMPGWMTRIDALSTSQALGTGLLLSAGNPKNLALGVGAGTSIGQVGLPPAELGIVVGVFTAVASLTTGGPVLYYLTSGENAKAVLEDLRVWLMKNLSTVMTIVLLILGAVAMGNGIRSLSAGVVD